MKKFYLVILTILSLTLTSCCGVYGQVYDDSEYSYGVTYSTVIRYGTPFYIDGILSYYLYDNIYYYPYIWEGRHYFRPFDHMQPRGFMFHPESGHRPDFRFRGPEGGRPMDYGIRGGNRPMMRGGDFERSSSRTTVHNGGNQGMRGGTQPQTGTRGGNVQQGQRSGMQPQNNRGPQNFRQPTISRQTTPQSRGGIQIGGGNRGGSVHSGASRGGGMPSGGQRGGRR